MASQRGFGPNDVFDEARASTFVGRWDRVARLGDGWITGMATPAELQAGRDAISAAAQAAGRALPEPFDVRVNLFLLVGDDAAAARAEGAAFMEDYHRRPMDDASIDRWLVCGPAGGLRRALGCLCPEPVPRRSSAYWPQSTSRARWSGWRPIYCPCS